MYKILFVDDDPNILKINRSYFEPRGYDVTTSDNVEDTIRLVNSDEFDCIVLDIVMGKGNEGYDICRHIREVAVTPVIFLTSLTAQDFKYQGFTSGGDDYLTKPYDLRELELRIDAMVKRYKGSRKEEEVFIFSPLNVNITSRSCSLNDEPLVLTGVEFDLLAFFCAHPNIPYSSDEIYAALWKMPDLNSTHTVQVHIARLRRKMDSLYPEHRFIQTVWGKGYIFVPQSGNR